MDWYFGYVGKIRCIENGIMIHIPTEYRATNLARRTWRNRTNVGIPKWSLELYAGPEEILVGTHHCCVATAKYSDCHCWRDCGGAICVYAFLVFNHRFIIQKQDQWKYWLNTRISWYCWQLWCWYKNCRLHNLGMKHIYTSMLHRIA